MEKHEHLPEVAEMQRFVIDNDIDVGIAAEIMDSLRWAGQAFQSYESPSVSPPTFWELVGKIAAAGAAIMKAEGVENDN